MLVLALDTSTAAVVAGVLSVDGGGVRVLAERAPVAARGHGELLSPSVAACLAEAGVAAAEVDAVVAGVGPGPFTGLRVGLVTAAAFADAIGASTYAVCSLDAVAADVPVPPLCSAPSGGALHDAEQSKGAADEVVPPLCSAPPGGALHDAEQSKGAQELLVLADARRHEVYWARYDAQRRRLDGPHVGAASELPADGSERVLDRHPRPRALVELALDRLRAGADSEPLTPLYLRRPDAVVPGAPKHVSQDVRR